MKDYKRLTKRITASNTGRTVLVVPSFKQDIIEQTHRLADLEDKIESGELVDRNEYLDYLLAAKDTSELTNKDREIEFFVKHNARVREDTDKELTALQKRLDNAEELPAIVMINRTLVNGKFKPTQKAQAFNGRIGVVYRDTRRWNGLLVDICSEKTNDYEPAYARLAELKGKERKDD